jgi:hypothetical protein
LEHLPTSGVEERGYGLLPYILSVNVVVSNPTFGMGKVKKLMDKFTGTLRDWVSKDASRDYFIPGILYL